MIYPILIFFHVLGIFGFLINHGVSISVFFALQRERDVEHIRSLLRMSATSLPFMEVSLLVL